MTTRYSKFGNNAASISFGYEGNSIPTDYKIPSCSIEDVDRAVFEFFDKQAVFQYKHQEGSKKVPVVFATGERFAVLRRKKPLRDKHGALVLPLISMMRTGINQTHSMGQGYSELLPMVVKQRFSNFDEKLQQLDNRPDLIYTKQPPSNSRTGALGSVFQSLRTEKRRKNAYEFITLPPVKFFTITYDITFWCQYTQQMTDMLTSLMTTYQNNYHRSVRLETPKGYWFVGQIGEQFSSGDNFDNMTDEERIVKYSFEMTVPAYLVAPDVPGVGSPLRSYVSSPIINFEVVPENFQTNQGIQSGKPQDYVLQDVRSVNDPLPGQHVAGKFPAAVDTRDYNGTQSTNSAFARSEMQGDPSIANADQNSNLNLHSLDMNEIQVFNTDNDAQIEEGYDLNFVSNRNRNKNIQGETVIRENFWEF